MKAEKAETALDIRERAAMPIKKALALLLKPARQTPSGTWSPRSFHRDTYSRIKVMWYCEILQRGGACATKAPRVTRTGTYGTGSAP